MSTLKTGALRGTSGTADSIQLHASNQSVTFPGDVAVTGDVAITGSTSTTAQPAFRAYGGPNSSTSNEILVFGSESFDIGSGYNTSDGKYTIPSGQGGIWVFCGSVYRDNDEDDGIFVMYKDSTQIAEGRLKTDVTNSSKGWSSLDVITIVQASVGDTFYLKNMGTNIHCNSTLSQFWGYKLG